MNRSVSSPASQIERWARRQLADYDAHQPGTVFAEAVQMDVATAYEVQSAVARLRCARGERIVGYKVGCTSPTIRAQLGIDHCVTGRIYDSEQHSSGAVLSRGDFAALAIEGELAVMLSREPQREDFASAEIPPCVARVFPVIELHNHVMRGNQPSAGELIANNAIHAGVVAGEGIRRDDVCGKRNWDDLSLSIYSGSRLVEQCGGEPLIHTIHASLEWLTKMVSDRGERLCEGQIILTGSIPSLIPIPDDCVIRVDASSLGNVAATFVS